MAHVSKNKGASLFGTVKGSRGAVYYVTTDDAGAISCTCPDFMNGKTARGTAVPDRVCKHLRDVLAGDLTNFTPRAAIGSARDFAGEIVTRLETVEKELLLAKTTNQVVAQLRELEKVKLRAVAFTDKLAEEIAQVSARVEQAVKTAEGKL